MPANITAAVHAGVASIGCICLYYACGRSEARGEGCRAGKENLMEFTNQMKLQVAKRELTMRRRVYPRWVTEGRMEAQDAEYEIAGMQAILEDYENAIQPQLAFTK
jgi:hypothetical protein